MSSPYKKALKDFKLNRKKYLSKILNKSISFKKNIELSFDFQNFLNNIVYNLYTKPKKSPMNKEDLYIFCDIISLYWKIFVTEYPIGLLLLTKYIAKHFLISNIRMMPQPFLQILKEIILKKVKNEYPGFCLCQKFETDKEDEEILSDNDDPCYNCPTCVYIRFYKKDTNQKKLRRIYIISYCKTILQRYNLQRYNLKCNYEDVGIIKYYKYSDEKYIEKLTKEGRSSLLKNHQPKRNMDIENCAKYHIIDLRNICKLCLMIEKDKKFFICGNCKKSRYCSKECQMSDWNEHKLICKS